MTIGPGAIYYWQLPITTIPPMNAPMPAPMPASSNNRATMDEEGNHGEKGSPDERGSSLHACPQSPCLPSFGMGKHEGNHGDIDAVTEELLARDEPPGVMVRNGYAISATPEDRKPLEPGQVTCRVWIQPIRPPAIKSGSTDDLDDFAAF